MPDLDLHTISIHLEAATGHDSIATIKRIYDDGTGRYRCVFPDCELARFDAEAMWRHVHFSRKHGQCFDAATPEQAWEKHCHA